MAEKGESPSQTPTSSPSFLEVKCKSSGKTRRFSIGTEAGFAVAVINQKLSSETESPLALHIEAFKENEEPITFGPNSVLVNYGERWILQTITELPCSGVGVGEHQVPLMRNRLRRPLADNNFVQDSGQIRDIKSGVLSVGYIAKIILAFILLFLLGTILTLALENLPLLLSFIYDPKLYVL